MQEKSVNISGAERAQIERKAVELFLKTSQARHPNESFYKDITKEIISAELSHIDQYIGSDVVGKFKHVDDFAFFRRVSRTKLIDKLFIYTLAEDNRRADSLLNRNFNLCELTPEDLVIDSKYRTGSKTAFPFYRYGYDIANVSDDIREEIETYNQKMEDIYSAMNKQLQTLRSVIESCKTTKAFNAKLPNLVSLYPPSVRRKLEAKNEPEDVELTEEERLMQEATNAIATANLLGD